MLAVVVVAASTAWLNWSGPFARPWVRCAQTIAVCSLLGLAYTGVVVNQLIARQSGAEAVMAEAKRIIPTNSRLVSLDPVHHKFIFLYGQPIDFVPWNEAERIPLGSYFCFNRYAIDTRRIPFAFEELAILNMDRLDSQRPEMCVIVARRQDGSDEDRLRVVHLMVDQEQPAR